MTDTRVTLDNCVGPYDCKWNGWSYRFSLEATRQVSAGTLEMADSYGFSSMDTIHVIDGREGGPDTVHIIDSGETFVVNEDGDRAARAVAVRIRWRGKTPTATPSAVTPQVRRAARKTKNRASGRGAARAVVICVPWQWVDVEGSNALDVIEPLDDGYYPIGGREWPWCVVTWTCACGYTQDWHETDCLCGLTRDHQPTAPLEVATWEAAATLRRLAPGATSALIDIHDDRAHIVAVYAGDTEINTADDGGVFDTETLGAADACLQKAIEGAAPADLASTPGWQHTPDDESITAYRITFPQPAN